MSALLSWWLVYSLRSLDVHGSEGLVFIFTAVSLSQPFLTVRPRTYATSRHKVTKPDLLQHATESPYVLQVMAASLVEDKVQTSLFITPFRSPEVQQLTGEAL